MARIVFPVKVQLPPDANGHRSVITSAKLIDDGATVSIWRWDGTGPTRVVHASVPLIDAGPKAWRIEALSGTYDVTKQDGCGCGHPLRYWSPRPHRLIASP